MSSSVVEVTSLADNGWYRAGQTLPLRVIFTKQATVTLTDGVTRGLQGGKLVELVSIRVRH